MSRWCDEWVRVRKDGMHWWMPQPSRAMGCSKRSEVLVFAVYERENDQSKQKKIFFPPHPFLQLPTQVSTDLFQTWLGLGRSAKVFFPRWRMHRVSWSHCHHWRCASWHCERRWAKSWLLLLSKHVEEWGIHFYYKSRVAHASDLLGVLHYLRADDVGQLLRGSSLIVSDSEIN